MKLQPLHRSANNLFVFFVEKLWVVSGVIFDVESESGIRISLSRQDFEVMCSKNKVFRYFWGYVQGARNFSGFFLNFHHLALLFPFKIIAPAVLSRPHPVRLSPFRIDGTLTRRAALRKFWRSRKMARRMVCLEIEKVFLEWYPWFAWKMGKMCRIQWSILWMKNFWDSLEN